MHGARGASPSPPRPSSSVHSVLTCQAPPVFFKAAFRGPTGQEFFHFITHRVPVQKANVGTVARPSCDMCATVGVGCSAGRRRPPPSRWMRQHTATPRSITRARGAIPKYYPATHLVCAASCHDLELQMHIRYSTLKYRASAKNKSEDKHRRSDLLLGHVPLLFPHQSSGKMQTCKMVMSCICS